MDPSPTPKLHHNPKMDNCPALQLFGAGREKRIYAIPAHTTVVSLTSRTIRLAPYRFDAPCALCGAENSYLDEIVTDDKGGRDVRLLRHRLLQSRRAAIAAASAAPPHKERARYMNRRSWIDDEPLLLGQGGSRRNCGRPTARRDASFALYPGEVLAIAL